MNKDSIIIIIIIITINIKIEEIWDIMHSLAEIHNLSPIVKKSFSIYLRNRNIQVMATELVG